MVADEAVREERVRVRVDALDRAERAEVDRERDEPEHDGEPHRPEGYVKRMSCLCR